MDDQPTPPTRRPYRLSKRAASQADTRRRIIAATSELHASVGPAATRISDVARRAGVQRITVYAHFPDQASLLAACSTDWRALHPTPSLAGWSGIDEPGRRLRLGLGQLYAWYRETEPMTANVLRDAETMPALRAIVDAGLDAYLSAATAILLEPFRARGRRRARLVAAARLAVAFSTWRALAGIDTAEAVELVAGLVELAGDDSRSSVRPVLRRSRAVDPPRAAGRR